WRLRVPGQERVGHDHFAAGRGDLERRLTEPEDFGLAGLGQEQRGRQCNEKGADEGGAQLDDVATVQGHVFLLGLRTGERLPHLVIAGVSPPLLALVSVRHEPHPPMETSEPSATSQTAPPEKKPRLSWLVGLVELLRYTHVGLPLPGAVTQSPGPGQYH